MNLKQDEGLNLFPYQKNEQKKKLSSKKSLFMFLSRNIQLIKNFEQLNSKGSAGSNGIGGSELITH